MIMMIVTAAVIILAMGALAWHASTRVLDLQERLGPR
jgi:hypothetical protein